MAKKSLGDLLREEAQKNLEPNGQESASESSELEITAFDATPTELLEADESSIQEPLPELTAQTPANTSASLYAKTTRATKADLEAMVSELRKVVQQSQRQERSLQQQIIQLQSQLQEQKTLVEKLGADLAKTDQLKLELEQAKKVILQLSEANSKTSEKANTSEKQIQQQQNLKIQKLPLKKSSYPLIQSTPPSTALSNEDVGWVD